MCRICLPSDQRRDFISVFVVLDGRAVRRDSAIVVQTFISCEWRKEKIYFLKRMLNKLFWAVGRREHSQIVDEGKCFGS